MKVPLLDLVSQYKEIKPEMDAAIQRVLDSGYFILGAIIEAVTGKPYDDILQEKILDPVGMKDTGYDRPVPLIKNRAGWTGFPQRAFVRNRIHTLATHIETMQVNEAAEIRVAKVD